MNGKLSNGWRITKLSFTVLSKDKELFLLPVMTGLAQLALILLFLFPLGFEESVVRLYTEVRAADGEGFGTLLISFLLQHAIPLFLLMVISATIANFFQAAVIHAASDRLDGRNPTLKEALGSAVGNLPAIIKWSFLESGVLFLLQLLDVWLEEKGQFFASLITSAVGVTWSLVTFLMLPVIILEQQNTYKGVERSWHLFKRCWGEQVVAAIGFGLLGLLIIVPFGTIALILYIAMESPQAAIYTFLAGIGLMQMVTFTLQGAWRAALYHYAVMKKPPIGFVASDFTSAFKPK